MAFGDAWGHDGLSYSGKEMRELVEALTGGLAGVTGGVDALKVSQQTVAAATVKVAEGGFVIPATGAGLGGSYQGWNDADLNSPTISPTAANGRKDRLIVRVTAGVPALEVVEGTASGSPAEPSITGDNYLELALITLPASTTNITDAMITDRRVRLAAGTPVICTSTTRPASPFEGLDIYETDTDRRYLYTGSAWLYLGGGTSPYNWRITKAIQAIDDSTDTAITFDAEDFDTGGNHTGSGATGTIAVAGDYMIGAGCKWATHTTGARRMTLMKNGVAFARDDVPASGDSNQTMVSMWRFAAGDTLGLNVAQFAGGPLNCLDAVLWVAKLP